jgi:hypothetical protein
MSLRLASAEELMGVFGLRFDGAPKVETLPKAADEMK